MKNRRQSVVLGLLIVLFVTMSLTILPVAAQPQSRIVALAWSPDGSKISIVDTSGTLHLWDALTLKSLLDIPSPVGSFDAVTWNPDGSRIATNTNINDITHVSDDGIRIWNTSNGQLIAFLPEPGDSDNGMGLIAWSPDGTKLASAQFTGSGTIPVHIWTATNDNYRLLATTQGIPTQVRSIAWSPDSKQLAISDYTGLYLLNDFSTATPTAHRVAIPYGLFSVIWNPDDQELAINSLIPSGLGYDGKIRILNSQNDKETLALDAKDPILMAWNSTGDRLASTVANAISIWDTSSGKQLESYPTKTLSFSWSPFGGRLAYVGDVLSSAASRTQTLQSGAVQIIVPAPSTSELQAITQRCAAPSVQQQLTTRLTAKQFSDFASEVKSMSKDQISPACAADLIAVANALQSAP